MKTFLKFCMVVICLFLVVDLFSQNFISERKTWSIVSKGGMEKPWSRTSTYQFSGDTTVQGTNYKILFRSEDEQKKIGYCIRYGLKEMIVFLNIGLGPTKLI